MEGRELIKKWMAWKSNRDRKQYTFRALASDAGINPNYLSNVMTGIRNPGIKTLKNIAGAFGISMAEFYNGPVETTSPVPEIDIPENNATQAPDSEITEAVKKTRSEKSSLTKSGEKEISTEKIGLKISRNATEEFDKLFSTLGYDSADIFSPEPSFAVEESRAEESETNSAPTETVVQDSLTVAEKTAPRKKSAFSEDITPEEEPKKSTPSETGISDTIPLIENKFSGDIRELTANYEKEKTKYTSIPRPIGIKGDNVFSIRVEDDSMIPDLGAGDILIIDPDMPFENTKGGIGVVRHQGSFKIRKIFVKGKNYRLVPSNSLFEPEIIPKKNTTILKVARWIQQTEDKF